MNVFSNSNSRPSQELSWAVATTVASGMFSFHLMRSTHWDGLRDSSVIMVRFGRPSSAEWTCLLSQSTSCDTLVQRPSQVLAYMYRPITTHWSFPLALCNTGTTKCTDPAHCMGLCYSNSIYLLFLRSNVGIICVYNNDSSDGTESDHLQPTSSLLLNLLPQQTSVSSMLHICTTVQIERSDQT